MIQIGTRLFLLFPGVLLLPVGAGRTRSLLKPEMSNINGHYLMIQIETRLVLLLPGVLFKFLPVGAGRSLLEPEMSNINIIVMVITDDPDRDQAFSAIASSYP